MQRLISIIQSFQKNIPVFLFHLHMIGYLNLIFTQLIGECISTAASIILSFVQRGSIPPDTAKGALFLQMTQLMGHYLFHCHQWWNTMPLTDTNNGTIILSQKRGIICPSPCWPHFLCLLTTEPGPCLLPLMQGNFLTPTGHSLSLRPSQVLGTLDLQGHMTT